MIGDFDSPENNKAVESNKTFLSSLDENVDSFATTPSDSPNEVSSRYSDSPPAFEFLYNGHPKSINNDDITNGTLENSQSIRGESIANFLETLRCKNTFLEVGEKNSASFVCRSRTFDGSISEQLQRSNTLFPAKNIAPDNNIKDFANIINGAVLLADQIRNSRIANDRLGTGGSSHHSIPQTNDISYGDKAFLRTIQTIAQGRTPSIEDLASACMNVSAKNNFASNDSFQNANFLFNNIYSKNFDNHSNNHHKLSNYKPHQTFDDAEVDGSETTVMLRNIPNKYTQSNLLDVIAMKGFFTSYDFFYLPVDFKNGCNMGYAFINFSSHEIAVNFMNEFKGYHLPTIKSTKVCDVCWARVQGLSRNIEHYRNSPVNDIPQREFRPLLFDSSGVILPFPAPDADRPKKAPLVRPLCSNGNAFAPSSLCQDYFEGMGAFTENSGNANNKVFVGGLAACTTSTSLRNYFESATGDASFVLSCNVVCDKRDSSSRGFGFCTFANSQVTDNILKKKHWIDGQSVGIRFYSGL